MDWVVCSHRHEWERFCRRGVESSLVCLVYSVYSGLDERLRTMTGAFRTERVIMSVCLYFVLSCSVCVCVYISH